MLFVPRRERVPRVPMRGVCILQATESPAPAAADAPRTTTLQPLLVACAAIGAIWLVVVAWRFAAGVVAPWDSKNQFYAFFRFLASAIDSGVTPFWNPYHYGGHPAIADPQSLIFAPLFVLWAVFDPAPSMQAFDLIVYAHLLIGGLAIAVIGWRAGWPTAACVLAAVVFMLGGGASGRLQHTGHIVTYGLFPLAFLLLQLALQRRSIVLAATFGVVAATVALGRNQIALLFSFLLLAAALVEIATAQRPWRYLADRGGVLATMAIIVAAVIAVPTLLTVQFAELSNRPHIGIAKALEGSLHPTNLATLVVPNIFGSHQFPYWGPNWETLPEVSGSDQSFSYLFVGTVPVVLLLWFGIAGGRAFRRGCLFLTVVFVIALLYILGRYTPFFAWTFEWVPGVNFFRRPLDGSFVLVVALALLAGHLLSDYVRDGRPRTRAAIALLLTAGMLAIMAWAVIFSARSGQAATAAIEALKVAPLALIVIAVLAIARTLPTRRLAAAGVVAIAVAELLWWNGKSVLNSESQSKYAVLEAPDGAEAKALAILEQAIRERQRNGERPRVEIVGVGGPWQNLAVVRGLEAINGYNPLRIGAYDRLIAPGETTYLPSQRVFPASFEGYDCPLARALGLEYVVLDRPIEQAPHLAQRLVADVLYPGPKIWIYRLRHAMPRLTFQTRFQIADADGVGRLGELLSSPSSERVLIDDDTPPQGVYGSLAPMQGGKARIVAWRPDRIEITTDSPQGGMLALHETYYPGWVAEIDGKPTRILRADVLFRGVEVPAGRRQIVFRYAPYSLANLTGALATMLHRPR